jgi:transcriptional regulator with GAF, ATPase, and Fis domain
MATQASWISEVPTGDREASFGIEDAASAEFPLGNNELCGGELPRIVGHSTALRRVLGMVQVVAPTEATVLICGETGTGKELIAEAIHKCSDRSNGPFVKVNCAAIPAGLLESELFGHERGAFTSAIAQRAGRFELASRGTVFLDEIGELPLELQPKLLRVLEEGEFERLGSSRTLKSGARLIAATNRDLKAMVNDQEFRPDLYYRLNVFPLHVSPLRDRPTDIPLLVRHFAQQFSQRMNKSIDTIPPEIMTALVRYHWPGNVRELQNVIERAVILSTGLVLNVPTEELHFRTDAQPVSYQGKGNLQCDPEDAERQEIIATLEKTNGRVAGPSGAAALLGMSRPMLQFCMQKLGISVSRPATFGWPGKIRDLEHETESAVPVSEDPSLRIPPLNHVSQVAVSPGDSTPHSDTVRLFTLAEAEREYISEVVEMTNGLIAGKGGAAEVLGVPPSTLRNRMKKLGIRSKWRAQRPVPRLLCPGLSSQRTP